MGNPRRGVLLPALLALALCCASPASAKSAVSSTKPTSSLHGKVVLAANAGSPADPVVSLYTDDGQHLTTFCDSDGSFVLQGVPRGKHMLQVHLLGSLYPEMRVDTTSRHGAVATFIQTGSRGSQIAQISEPFVVYPVGTMQFYETRKPINVLGLLKSPYGIMAVLALFVIFVFPMFKVDPVEYKEFMGDVQKKK